MDRSFETRSCPAAQRERKRAQDLGVGGPLADVQAPDFDAPIDTGSQKDNRVSELPASNETLPHASGGSVSMQERAATPFGVAALRVSP